MFDELINQDKASQVTADRLEAQRQYQEALAEVDRSVPKLVAIHRATMRVGEGGEDGPGAGSGSGWEIMREDPGGTTLGRLLAFARKVLRAPLSGVLRRQQAFNHKLLVELGQEMLALARFHHDIIQYLQRVAPLIDADYRHQLVVGSGLAAAYREEVNAIYALRWEATLTRDRRTAAALDELRTSIATVHQAGATLKRELERVLAQGPPLGQTARATGDSAGPAVPAPTVASAQPAVTAVRPASNPNAVNAYKYVGFEDRFRGSESDIRGRLESYVQLFEGSSEVLDIGCGRGEFLAALRDRGVSGRGVDINHEMVELCRSSGLLVDEGDALAHLEQMPDGSLGGLFAAQVVEHFQPGYLMRLLDVAFFKLRPGSKLVLETLNPACWSAFFDSYIRDITHVWPLHPETLKYLVTAAGFQRLDLRFLAAYPPDDKLQRVAVPKDASLSPTEWALIEAIDSNVDRLNGQLFSNRDYVVIGERL